MQIHKFYGIYNIMYLFFIIYYVILVILVTTLLLYLIFRKNGNVYIPIIEVRPSPIHGRGVFSKKEIKNGEIIEIVPLLPIIRKTIEQTILLDFILNLPPNLICDENDSTIMLGYGSIYNHSDTNNAEWLYLNNKELVVVALKDISRGEEICVNYGDKYWKTRSKEKKL